MVASVKVVLNLGVTTLWIFFFLSICKKTTNTIFNRNLLFCILLWHWAFCYYRVHSRGSTHIIDPWAEGQCVTSRRHHLPTQDSCCTSCTYKTIHIRNCLVNVDRFSFVTLSKHYFCPDFSTWNIPFRRNTLSSNQKGFNTEKALLKRHRTVKSYFSSLVWKCKIEKKDKTDGNLFLLFTGPC